MKLPTFRINLRLLVIQSLAVTVFMHDVQQNNSTGLQLSPTNTSIEYFTKHNRTSTVRLMIHVDSSLTKLLNKEHGPKTRRKMKFLAKRMVEDVDTIFQQTRLKRKIKFQLLGVKFLKKVSSLVNKDENGSKYLRSYCTWQATKKVNGWYYSVLITGLDLYYINENGAQIRKSTGRGYLSGMCSIKHSCSLIEWHPKNIGYLLSHEIAHSLGITHDGPPYNNCTAKGHMMGARYNVQNHPKTWSVCSRRALNNYLKSKASSCLRTSCDDNNWTCHMNN